LLLRERFQTEVRFFCYFSAAGWDRNRIPTKRDILEVFAPYGTIESLRLEKAYGAFLI
jgi:hypothetical protein